MITDACGGVLSIQDILLRHGNTDNNARKIPQNPNLPCIFSHSAQAKHTIVRKWRIGVDELAALLMFASESGDPSMQEP